MKSSVISKLSLVFLPSILLPTISLTVFGQQCSNAAGTVTCASSQVQEPSCSVKDGKFDGKCASPNAQLYEKGKEDEFDADYASQVLGREVTTEELKRDAHLRNGLETGNITTADGRTTITFTPIGKVKAKIEQLRLRPSAFSQPVKIDEFALRSRFNKIRKESSLDEVLRQYRKLLNNPLLGTPVFLETLADELVKEKNFTDAIKVLELNAEVEKDSSHGYFKLAEAYSRRFKAENKAEDKQKAITSFEKVLTSTTADEKLRVSTRRRLEVLREQR